jgi:5-formaminoimidazole-4-carboxamide-1-(beta)-D-ribofuranosyl 5'-monophosphate synthetase
MINIKKILNSYDKNNITIATIGSHSALDICKGAKDEGFRTLVICQRGREKTYSEYYKVNGKQGIVDDVLILNKFKDILKPEIQRQLQKENVIFIPHRSFEVYLDFEYDKIEAIQVPYFGSRYLLKAEERTSQRNQYYLMKKANIRMPKLFKNPDDIDRLVIIKTPEIERAYERAFFFAMNYEDYKKKSKKLIKKGVIDKDKLKTAVIEEFIIGPVVNFNYFYSPLKQRVELLGTDTRRQTNIDGLLRLTAHEQLELLKLIYPKFEEAGHIACTVLESMLEMIFDMGEKFVKITKEEYPPGIIGPFAFQCVIIPGPPKKEAVCFDISLRVQGSPGTKFTPYMEYLYGFQVSTGKRIAMEIKEAVKLDKLDKVCT